MRGKIELTQTESADAANETKGGLKRDYITQWSYGISETFSLFIPNVKGGASVPLSENKTAMKKAKAEYRPIYQSLGQYWGEQPGTSGPVYVGAFVFMLFILSLFILKGPMKWALLAATIISIMLSLGKNFMWFTDIFLDYIPMYDKFRAVSSILVVAEFTIPLLAIMGLNELVTHPEKIKQRMKSVYISAGITGGITLLFALLSGLFFGNYISTSEMAMLQNAVQSGYIPSEMLGGLISNLQEMREAIFTADAWTSLWIIIIGTLLLILFYLKKINAPILVGSLIVLCLLDMWMVNKRYLNDDMFIPKTRIMQGVAKTPTDEAILADGNADFRVLNFAANTFNENNTAYWHKSVGGYHAAKLRRYQELIENHISPEMNRVQQAIVTTQGELAELNTDSLSPVINMLNTKYYIFPIQNGTLPIENPGANGNAWFVSEIQYVDNANQELAALGQINTKETAVVDKRFQEQLANAPAIEPKDSTSSVELVTYEPNYLTYEVNSANGGVVVFSENYYPGWQAYLDGKPVDHARANYILRAMQVPAGNHKVEFKFDPHTIRTTEALANSAIAILVLVLLGAIALAAYNQRKSRPKTHHDKGELPF